MVYFMIRFRVNILEVWVQPLQPLTLLPSYFNIGLLINKTLNVLESDELTEKPDF